MAEAGTNRLARGCAGNAWLVTLDTVDRLPATGALGRICPRKDATAGSCQQLGRELALAELTAGERRPAGSTPDLGGRPDRAAIKARVAAAASAIARIAGS